MAALSGVARVTVSRVMNSQPNVSARTREKVLAAVEALGFAVNVRARQLAGGGHATVLLICGFDADQEPNSFYSSALEIGALRACAQQGCDLVRQSVDRAADASATILKLAEENRCARA
ncbi:LacI family DNA-binding transcriptional regulator [Sphingomonas sp. MMS24-JH45]